MQIPRLRFSVLQLMALVLAIAGSLALFRSLHWLLAVFLLGVLFLGLVIAFSSRQFFKNRRGMAANGFGVGSFLANVLIAALCVYQLDWGGYGMMVLVAIFILPVGIGCGMAWAGQATQPEAAKPWSPWLAWTLVVALCGLPPTMMATLWPLRLAFVASRPALDALADRVAGGQPVTSPEWAGAYLIVDSAVDSENGDVGLVIVGSSPESRLGFVRISASPRLKDFGPFKGLDLDLVLDSRWRYQGEE